MNHNWYQIAVHEKAFVALRNTEPTKLRTVQQSTNCVEVVDHH